MALRHFEDSRRSAAPRRAATAPTSARLDFCRQTPSQPCRGASQLDAVLARAVQRRNASAPVLARYFDGSRFDMPGARLSDHGIALRAGPKELYATQELIDTGNKQLASRQARLALGKGHEYVADDFVGGLSHGAGLPLYRVIPRMGPSTAKQIDPMMKMLSEANPAPSDSVGQLSIKNDAYEAFVKSEMAKIQTLVDRTLTWLKAQSHHWFWGETVREANVPMSKEQYMELRTKILEPWMQENKLATQYLDEARLYVTTKLGAPPPSMADVGEFATRAAMVRADVLENELARARADELILPTDCFTAALALGATHVKNKASPEIGETHFVDLGSDTGWNNHWATVIMRDGEDSITIENAADITKGPFDRTTWWFGMYGRRAVGQSFEEEYRALSATRSSGIAKRIDDIADRRKVAV